MNKLLSAVLLLSVTLSAHADDSPLLSPSASLRWQVGVAASETAVGQGLPVLALTEDDWPRYGYDDKRSGKAWRSVRAEVYAIHPDGWQVAAIARADAWVQGNADAVAIAAVTALKSDLTEQRVYQAQARALGFSGQGIKLGTPWLALLPWVPASSWQWQADVQILQLSRLRQDDASGTVQYQGGSAYAINARAERYNTGITGPFLASPGTAGQGAALSLAVQGMLAPGLHLALRGDDVASQLRWSDMTGEVSVLNSQVTSRAPDGTLDYAPVIQGQQTRQLLRTRIGPHWQVKASWTPVQPMPAGVTGTLRLDYKAGISQVWLGAQSPQAPQKLHWALALEPLKKALGAELQWRGLQLALYTDGKGQSSQFRRMSIRWNQIL